MVRQRRLPEERHQDSVRTRMRAQAEAKEPVSEFNPGFTLFGVSDFGYTTLVIPRCKE